MIIEFFLNLILGFFRVVLIPDHIEDLPDTLTTTLATLSAILIDGIRIINAFIDETYIAALIVFVIAFNGAITAYHVIMWVLRKIPFLGID